MPANTKQQSAPNPDMSSFKLSRVFAEGWNAARNLSSLDDTKAVARLNPYAEEPARSRWIEGFTKAREH